MACGAVTQMRRATEAKPRRLHGDHRLGIVNTCGTAHGPRRAITEMPLLGMVAFGHVRITRYSTMRASI